LHDWPVFTPGRNNQILAVAASVLLRARAAEILHFRFGLKDEAAAAAMVLVAGVVR